MVLRQSCYEGRMGRVLALSSHVARGHVGLVATVPALSALGQEVWALPTVILASRPGLGTLAKYPLAAADLAALLAALEADGCWHELDAVFTGYFASAEAVGAAAAAIKRLKQVNPGVIVSVDPVLGDGDRLYVAADIAAAIRDQLLTLATLATPNLFELGWLTGAGQLSAEPGGKAEVVAAARRLGVPTVVVTSAGETPQEIATALLSPMGVFWATLPKRRAIPNGAGDLFAGLLLGYLLRGQAAPEAFAASLADLDVVLAASVGRSSLALATLCAKYS
jgi:pyridoxine kinase